MSSGYEETEYGMGMTMTMMMQMTFEASNEAIIFIKDLKTKSNGQLLAACLVLFIIGVLYEGLKVARLTLAARKPSVSPAAQQHQHHTKGSVGQSETSFKNVGEKVKNNN